MYLEESRAILHISVTADDLVWIYPRLHLSTLADLIAYWVALLATVESEAFKTQSAIS